MRIFRHLVPRPSRRKTAENRWMTKKVHPLAADSVAQKWKGAAGSIAGRSRVRRPSQGPPSARQWRLPVREAQGHRRLARPAARPAERTWRASSRRQPLPERSLARRMRWPDHLWTRTGGVRNARRGLSGRRLVAVTTHRLNRLHQSRQQPSDPPQQRQEASDRSESTSKSNVGHAILSPDLWITMWTSCG